MALNKKKILLYLALAVTGMAGCKKNEPKSALPDMRLTLGSNDSKPMGGKVLKNMVEMAIDEATVPSNAQPFDEWYRTYLRESYNEASHAYFLVTPYLDIRQKEAEAMEKFISRGNTLILITNGFAEAFQKVFETDINYSPPFAARQGNGLAQTSKSLADSTLFGNKSYGYYYFPLTATVDTPKSIIKKVISFNENGKPDGWQMKVGSGELILISNAEAFSNYFLLTGHNYLYALGILSYLPEYIEKVYYDEFYRRNTSRQPEDRSIFDAILSQPALRWAFWLLIAMIGLAVFTNLFRKQRIIPVKVPNNNTTVAFTETIARLYYHQKDNTNIAQKMIRHFLEHIRSVYYLPHQKLDKEFAAMLAGKTNQPVPKTERLVQRMQAIMNGMQVSDDMLLELNRDLQQLISPASHNAPAT
jgi:hypothetical protein